MKKIKKLIMVVLLTVLFFFLVGVNTLASESEATNYYNVSSNVSDEALSELGLSSDSTNLSTFATIDEFKKAIEYDSNVVDENSYKYVDLANSIYLSLVDSSLTIKCGSLSKVLDDISAINYVNVVSDYILLNVTSSSDITYLFDKSLNIVNTFNHESSFKVVNSLYFDSQIYVVKEDNTLYALSLSDSMVSEEISHQFNALNAVTFGNFIYSVTNNSLVLSETLDKATEIKTLSSDALLISGKKLVVLDSANAYLVDNLNNVTTISGAYTTASYYDNLALSDSSNVYLYNSDEELVKTISLSNTNIFYSNNELTYVSNSINKITNICNVTIKEGKKSVNNDTILTYDDLVCTDLLNNSLVEYKLLSDSILYIVKKTNNIYFYSVDLDVDYQTSFTRNGVTEKLVDNDIYLLGDVINFSGEATLNGNQIETNYSIDKTGVNTLNVILSNGLTKTYTINVFDLKGVEKGQSYETNEAPVITFDSLENLTVKLNGEVFTSGSEITTFGNYTLDVCGIGSKVIDSYTFTINPTITIGGKIINVINSKPVIYSSNTLGEKVSSSYTTSTFSNHTSISWTGSAKSAILNNHYIYSSYTTYNPGNNILTLIGCQNYQVEVKFIVNPTCNLVEGKDYIGSVLPVVSGGNFKLNDRTYNLGDIISEAGDYKFEIYNESNELVKTYKFRVVEEELNVSTTKNTFNQGVIPAVCGNNMTLNGEAYQSGQTVSKAGDYTLVITYPTYSGSTNSTLDTYDSLTSTYTVTYYFEIVKGVNVKSGDEFFDSVTILFAGYETSSLSYLENGIVKNIENFESGYKLDIIGKYTLNLDDETIEFIVSPLLNVENAKAYLGNVSVFDYYTFKDTFMSVSLTSETGTTTSNLSTTTSLDTLKGKKLSKGTYSLIINGRGEYSKTINFIVIDSSVIGLGSIYLNSKSFEFNMYGVTVYLTFPQTSDQSERLTETYIDNSEIKSVGKHYFTFKFKLNDIETTTESTNTVIYFYVKPVVTVDGTRNDTTSIKVLDSTTITFKDGNGVLFNEFAIDSNSKTLSQDVLYNEVGNHTIKVTLDDISYNISLVVDTNYIYVESDALKVELSDYKSTTYTYNNKASFVTSNETALLTLDSDKTTNVYQTEINSVGNHSLYVRGTNNFIKELKFVVKEEVFFNSVKANSTLDKSTLSLADYTYDYDTVKSISIVMIGNASVITNFGTTDLTDAVVDSVGNYKIIVNGTNNYQATYMFQLKDALKINGASPVSTYNDKVTITFDSVTKTTLGQKGETNQVEILTNDSFDNVGSYSITVYGKNSYTNTYSFSIENEITYSTSLETKDLTSGLIIANTISLNKKYNANYKTISLNGQSLLSLPTLDTIGNYTLVLTDYFDNEISYNITIKSDVLFNGNSLKTSYTSEVVASLTNVKASATLNDDAYSFGEEIKTIGKNKIVLSGNGDYIETYIIFIKETNSKDKMYETVSLAKQNSVESLSFDFGTTLTYTISSTDDVSNQKEVNKYGLYTVTIKGINYTSNYYFYIKLVDNLDDNSYEISKTIESNAKSYTINSSDNTLNNVGNYQVKFVGASNETTTKNVLIKEVVTNADSSDSQITPTINGSITSAKLTYVSNSKETSVDYKNEAITTIGTYKLIICGENDYVSTYSFTLSAPVLEGDVTLASSIDRTSAVKLNQYSNINYSRYVLDGTLIPSITNYQIDSIGKHTLDVYDINNNKTSYSINIYEQSSGSTLYTTKVDANANAYDTNKAYANFQSDLTYTIKLDGNNYTKLDLINSYGYHEIVVEGYNYTSKPYYVYVNLDTNIQSNYDLIAQFSSNANSILVDDEENNGVIDQVGNHKVTFIGNDTSCIKNVTISETISNFKSNTTYTSSINPLINGKGFSLTLNGKTFENGTNVNVIGSYTLIVSGLNYINSYTFNLSSSIVNGNTTSHDSQVLSNQSDLVYKSYSLNGTSINLPYTVNTIGYNKLICIDANDKEYSYTVDIFETMPENVYDSSAKALANSFDSNTYGGVTFGDTLSYTLTLDGASYQKADKINVWGIHKIVINGVNYTNEYYVSINLDTNVLDGEVASLEKIIISNAKYTYIDTIETNSTNKVGNHIVSLISEDGREIDYNIVVKEVVEVASSSEAFTPLINGNITKALLNGEVYNLNTVINYVGNYSLVIYGENDYVSDTYTFSLTSKINVLTNSKNAVDVSLLSKTLNYFDVSLNGKSITLPYNINTVGNNSLVFTDVNLVETKYNVLIEETVSKDSISLYDSADDAKKNGYEINDNVVKFNTNLIYKVLVDNVLYDSSSIDSFGLHKIDVVGVNYQNTYYIYVLQNYQTKLLDNGLYQIVAANAKIYVNDTLVNINDTISTIGNNKIKLVSSDNQSVYEFVLTVEGSIDNLIEGNTYNTNVELSLNGHASKILVNGEVVETLGKYSTVGDYSIEIDGINSYKRIYTFTIAFIIEGLEETYTTSAIIKASGVEMYIDGSLYNSGDEYSVVGTHKLFVHGLENVKDDKYYTFTILENVSGIESGATYNSSKTIVVPNAKNIIINKGQADEFEITSGDTISKIGNFTLNVIGSNDYVSDTYTFTIEANVLGLDFETSTNAVKPIFVNNSLEAKTYLNGKIYNYETISKIGSYHFEIKGQGNYSKTYDFVIKSSLLFNGLKLKNCYNDIVTFENSNAVSFNSVLVNGNLTTSYLINSIGNNEIQLNGEGNYSENILVTIKETNNNLIYDSIDKAHLNKQDSVNVTFGDSLSYDLILDDKSYTKNDLINSFGLHKLVINGVNYSATYYVDIKLLTDLEDNQIYDLTKSFTANSNYIVDNNESDLTNIGNHTVKFIGNSNEEVIYHVVVREIVTGANSSFDEITPTISGNILSATLNGENYNFEKINKAGNYTLVINGLNGYTNEYTFSLNNDLLLNDTNVSSIEVIDSLVLSNSSATLSYQSVTLNGEEIVLPYTLNSVGNSLVETTDINGTKKSYTILVKETVEVSDSESELTPVCASNISSATLNGANYNFEKLNKAGNYTLVINGLNGYTNEYTFTLTTSLLLDDEIIGAENTKLATAKLSLSSDTLNYNSITLNGEEITLPYHINTIGNNKVVITDANNNQYTYNVLVKETSVGTQLFNDSTSAKLNKYVSSDNVIAKFNDDLIYTINLDDKLYKSELINFYGLHKISVIGVDYTNDYFVYIDLDTNLTNNNLYESVVRINANATILLDNEEIENDYLLNVVGNHVITFIGVFAKSIYDITVKENVIGIEQNGIYQNKPMSINVLNATLRLNGNPYINDTKITDVGYYTLEVFGSGNYYNKYTFVNEYKATFNDLDKFNNLTVVIPNATLYLDGKPYSNELVEEIGNHVVTICGVGEYKKEIRFTIEPNIEYNQVLSENHYNATFSIFDNKSSLLTNTNYKTIKIDGITYINGTQYSSVGNHTLEIIGTNDYIYTKEFTVSAYVPVENNGNYTSKIVIDNLDADMELDGKKISEDTVIKNGTHTLVVKGANGYEEVFTFTYNNPNILYAIIYFLVIVIIVIIAVLLLLFKKRKKENLDD